MQIGHHSRHRATTFSTGLLALMMAVALFPAEARVFSRWRTGADAAMLMRPVDGRLLYETPVTLNGTRGELSVYGVDLPLDTLQAELRQLLPGAVWEGGDSLAFGTFRDQDAVLRVLLTQPQPLGPSMVFALRQAPGDDRADRPPPLPPIPGLSIPAGATLHFVAQDLQSRSSLIILHSDAPPGDSRATVHRSLAAGGWAPIVQPASGPSPDGLAFYGRGDDILMLAVSAHTSTGAASTITVLHKRPGMK